MQEILTKAPKIGDSADTLEIQGSPASRAQDAAAQAFSTRETAYKSFNQPSPQTSKKSMKIPLPASRNDIVFRPETLSHKDQVQQLARQASKEILLQIVNSNG